MRNTSPIEIKSISSTGEIEGVAASYNLDLGGDKIEPGAFERSLSVKPEVPMYADHVPSMATTLGRWTDLKETADGLLAKGRIVLGTESGRHAFELIKDGAVSGLSIGYVAKKSYKSANIRHLTEIDLHEISIVSSPMNPMAQISNVKSAIQDGELPSLKDFEKFLREEGFSRTQAIAIANKGLAALHRSEFDQCSEADFYSALTANFSK